MFEQQHELQHMIEEIENKSNFKVKCISKNVVFHRRVKFIKMLQKWKSKCYNLIENQCYANGYTLTNLFKGDMYRYQHSTKN